MKKFMLFIVVVLSLCMFQIRAFCAEQPVTYSVSLEQAKKMALEHSPELECWDVSRQNLQIQLNAARTTQNENKNTPVYVSQNYEVIFVKQGYYVESYISQLKLSDFEKEKIVNTIEYDVTQKYYNAKNASKMCEISRNSLKRAEETQNIIQKQYELGMCTAHELKNAQIAVKQCRISLDKCINSLALAEESLKITLGIDCESKIDLIDEIAYTNFETNLDDDLVKCMGNRYDVQALIENEKMANIYFKIASGLNQKSSTYFSAYTNHIKAEHNLESGRKNIALLIKSAYYSVIDSMNNTDIAIEQLEYAREN